MSKIKIKHIYVSELARKTLPKEIIHSYLLQHASGKSHSFDIQPSGLDNNLKPQDRIIISVFIKDGYEAVVFTSVDNKTTFVVHPSEL